MKYYSSEHDVNCIINGWQRVQYCPLGYKCVVNRNTLKWQICERNNKIANICITKLLNKDFTKETEIKIRIKISRHFKYFLAFIHLIWDSFLLFFAHYVICVSERILTNDHMAQFEIVSIVITTPHYCIQMKLNGFEILLIFIIFIINITDK